MVTAGRAHGFHARPQRHLLSGLIRCGICGGSFISAGGRNNQTRFACSTRREKGTCDNRRTVRGALLEERILAALEAELLHEDVIAAAIRAYGESRRAAAAARAAAGERIERRLGEISRELKRLVDAIAEGTASRAVTGRISDLEAEEDRLRARQAAAPAPDVVRLHPGVADRYRALVRDVRGILAAAGDTQASRAAIMAVRELVEAVVVYPEGDPAGRDLELTGQLAALLAGGERMGKVVAGTGFEPVTFRL